METVIHLARKESCLLYVCVETDAMRNKKQIEQTVDPARIAKYWMRDEKCQKWYQNNGRTFSDEDKNDCQMGTDLK